MPIIAKHLGHPYSNVFGNRLVDQHLPHTCFRRISPQRFLVSRFVAKTWPAFRNLWQESGSADRSSGHSTNVREFGVDGANHSAAWRRGGVAARGAGAAAVDAGDRDARQQVA